MALTKSTAVDKIEIVGDYDIVQVREVTNIIEDGEIISQKFNRYSINPTDDITNETVRVQNICNAVHTDEIKAAYTNYINSSEE